MLFETILVADRTIMNNIINMAQLIWKEEYNLGIKSIDEQHQKLIDLINDLYLAKRSDAATELIEKVITGLIDYTEYHFIFEEKWFERINYENQEDHIKEHQVFRDKLKKYQKELNKNDTIPVSMVQNLVSWLQEWLVDHILVTDRKYIGAFAQSDIQT